MATRRDFLKFAGASASFGLAGAGHWLPALADDEVKVAPGLVRLTPDVEPLVEWIERTPRSKCLPAMTARIQQGLPYRNLLAALFLAGIRNVNPQPPGFKFHCVFVMHAAHQMSLDAEKGDRWLPLLWALDNFKASQEKDVAEGDFRLGPVQGKLPAAKEAWAEFDRAMQDWDESKADRAIVALVRHAGAHEVIEGLWKYGAHDYRNIGHKAIFVANTWRTLQTIGWRHAEPAMRSLVLGLLDFGKDEQVNSYRFQDQSYHLNVDLARAAGFNLPAGWTKRRGSRDAVVEIVDAIRSGDFRQVCQDVLADIQHGALGGDTVWDAIHLAAGELMMRQPGIYGIHTVTSVNGLRFAYQTCLQSRTRLLLTLQGLGWMCQFRNFMGGKSQGLNDRRITSLTPADISADPAEALEDIFAGIGKDTAGAAAKAAAYASAGRSVSDFKRLARRLIIRKGSDAHDYKYAVGIFEDLDLIDPEWRPHLLATSVYHLKGSQQRDNPAVREAAQALR